MKCPKVSVCIPTYNYSRYIAETIESVLSQSFSDFELLIVDDCSPDDTAKIVSVYEQSDSRIQFRVNDINMGMVQNWNYTMGMARGEYIKFVFGDDICSSPDAIAKMVRILDEDRSVTLVAAARNLINDHSEKIGVMSHFPDMTVDGTDIITYCLSTRRNLIGEPSVVMFRKSDAGRGFSPDYKQLVDLEMWFHLMAKGRLSYISEPLFSFRIHDQQQTEKNKKTRVDLVELLHLNKSYLWETYIKYSVFLKWYLDFDGMYCVWKSYKTGAITREEAVAVISSTGNYGTFRWMYLLYKTCKPVLKRYVKFKQNQRLNGIVHVD